MAMQVLKVSRHFCIIHTRLLVFVSEQCACQTFMMVKKIRNEKYYIFCFQTRMLLFKCNAIYTYSERSMCQGIEKLNFYFVLFSLEKYLKSSQTSNLYNREPIITVYLHMSLRQARLSTFPIMMLHDRIVFSASPATITQLLKVVFIWTVCKWNSYQRQLSCN